MELAKVTVQKTNDIEVTIHACYYVVEYYGNNITPEVIATFMGFQDARRFVFAQSKKFPWLTHDIRRMHNNEVMDIGAEEE